MISLEKGRMLTPLQKLHSNVGDLGKIIVATVFEWLPKVQKIAQSGHTDYDRQTMKGRGTVGTILRYTTEMVLNKQLVNETVLEI